MFEKISNAAEKLATNVSQSRRGFLGRLGKAAMGAAAIVGGLLALPAEAQAGPINGCEVDSTYLTGFCIDNKRGTCFRCYGGGCIAGARSFISVPLCRTRVWRPCSCNLR